MYKIALVIPYFGRFNNYFDLWLKSCEINPDIDFLVFTDDETPCHFPKNVHVSYFSFDEMVKKAQKCFDFPISLTRCYKLCDFRPAYGEIFSEELNGYDFWGYCDNDLIFGNIRKFITDDVLSTFDKILNNGHLTIIRNTKKMNTLYRMSSDIFPSPRYIDVFSSPDPFCFDEYGKGGVNAIAKHHGVKTYGKIDFIDLELSLFGFRCAPPRHSADEKNAEAAIFSWDEQGLLYHRRYDNTMTTDQVLYVHMQKRPMKREGIIENRFLIVPNKFLPFPSDCETIDIKTLSTLGKKKRVYPHFILMRCKNLRTKLKKSAKRIAKRIGF